MSFCEESQSFLFENRMHDSKEWFNEHRADYERLVLEPMRQLVTDLAPVMLSIDPRMVVEPKVGRCISRIFRDTRFSHDKSIFRDTMWLDLTRVKHGPSYWFEITPVSFSYGCGWYCATTKEADIAHELVLAGGAEYRNAKEAIEKQDVFSFEGDKYKRPRYPDAEPADREWLERKSVYLVAHSGDKEMLFSPHLAEKLGHDYQLIAPAYEFFHTIHALSGN